MKYKNCNLRFGGFTIFVCFVRYTILTSTPPSNLVSTQRKFFDLFLDLSACRIGKCQWLDIDFRHKEKQKEWKTKCLSTQCLAKVAMSGSLSHRVHGMGLPLSVNAVLAWLITLQVAE